MDLKGQHILTLGDLDTEALLTILDVSKNLKQEKKTNRLQPLMQGKTLATIFEKPSLRTRISFDVGFMLMGGNVINIRKEEINLGVREPIKDCARNISRYVDCIMIRTFAHSNIQEFAKYSKVPVINGLTDKFHPCQIVADLLTVQEKFNKLEGLKLAFIGDGNNVANSLLLGCSLVGMDITVAAPSGYTPAKDVLDKAQAFAAKMGSKVTIASDPKEAVSGANVVYTDVWASMGQEAEADERKKIFKPYQVSKDLLASANSNCIVMHCLPAHRDEEITDEVVEMFADVIFDQAENRMHGQNGVMACIVR